MELIGRTAVVTGASRGFGRAVAERLVRCGASVLLVARGEDLLFTASEELAAQATRPDQQVLALGGDASRQEDCAAVADLARRRFGGATILVNNAGVQGPIGALDEVDWAAWADAVRVNLCGTALMCRALLPLMRPRGYGKVINVSGGGAATPRPFLSAYAASKAAVVRLTETLAEEVRGTGIDVNAVAPGAMNTRMLDELLAAGPEKAGRAAHGAAVRQQATGGVSPDRGAALVAFLASAASDGITGRLLSAVWDDWAGLPQRREELDKSDIYTIRRVTPEDRGTQWKCA